MKKILRIGIAPVSAQRARSLAIAKGAYQRQEDEPHIWFPSVSAMSRVLSDENMALIQVIRERHPESLDALAKAAGKLSPNVSRSLHVMEQFGLVKLIRQGRCVVPQLNFDQVLVEF